MAVDPNFTKDPQNNCVDFSTANTNRDGSGTIADLVTAPTGGCLVVRLRVKAKVTTTAGMLRLFIHNGTSYFMIDEQVVSAITVGASTASFAWQKTFEGTGFMLKQGNKLGISTHNGEAFAATVEWAGFQ